MRLQSFFCLLVLSSLCTFWFLILQAKDSNGIVENSDVTTFNNSNNRDHLLQQKVYNGGGDNSSSFSSGNGIIFFVHIPKTGGTTIRDIFSNNTQFPQVEYIFVNSLKQFRIVQLRIEQRLSMSLDDKHHGDNNNKILFVEIHGHNTPTLIDLEITLRIWKQQVQTKHIPMFVFTLLREPIELAVSFFNFFHVFGDKRFGSQMQANLYNLRQTLQWNPQCLYLFAGERPYFRPDKYYNVTKEDCQKVASLLWYTENLTKNGINTQSSAIVDWVGATSQLSTETLPLLVGMVSTGMQSTNNLKLSSSSSSILQSVLSTSSNVAATRRQRNRPLSKSELDVETIQNIHRVTQLDQKLYNRLVMDRKD